MRYGALVGETWNALTLLAVLPRRRIHRRVAGRFLCSCGRACVRAVSRVRSGRVLSCGCAKLDYGYAIKHGMRQSREYSAWSSMKNRCLNTRNKDYWRYGARGVRVHQSWIDSFEAFFEHVGPRPLGYTLDRIDTRGHYEPGNVRWASPQQQAENTVSSWTVTISRRSFASLESAARACGVSTTTIVRWCDGYFDRRRNHFRPPKDGCIRRRTYA